MRELNFEFMSLEEAINILKYYKSRNCPAYGMFRETKITTEMSEDEIYKATGVLTPEQQEAEFRKWEEEYDKEIFEAYKAGKTAEEIKEIFYNQGHSGMSAHLECSIVATFLDKELGNYLYNS